jgi:hypothetical protein
VLTALPGDMAAGRSSTVGNVYFGLDGGAIFRSGNTYFFGGASGTAGVGLETVETTSQTPVSGSGIIWPESTTHRWSVSNNGGAKELIITGAAETDLTAQSANVGFQPIFTPPVTGLYCCNAYASVTRAATSSSTLPAVQVGWQDGDSSTNTNQSITPVSTANTVGTYGNGTTVFYAKAGVAIQIATSGYASSGATSMQYALHVSIERL